MKNFFRLFFTFAVIGVLLGMSVAFTDTAPAAGSRPTPVPTNTPAPTQEPPVGENLLVNPQFMDAAGSPSFAGWSQVNGYWYNTDIHPQTGGLHGPIPCGVSGSWLLQMDNDRGGIPNGNDTWPFVGGEDWAWQDITVSEPHTTLTIGHEEAHHMIAGSIVLTVYGRNNPAEAWQVVWQQDGVQSVYGTGKCNRVGPPAQFATTVQPAETFSEYRFEVYGKMEHPLDGLLWGNFFFGVE